ncbi:MAG: ABC transporter substrate-binding protein [Clostridium sp.]|uniref:ABC transporter substrate-binding protein n=1 Tax=Clostridium sp. TaxID=1506 RepID=UPI00290B1D7B|nr:ABC transporter substrate-binding protein [Clostridium sp.]MDU7336825.1 ABC transporter substrate-binding protein [Clostridium sp.]
MNFTHPKRGISLLIAFSLLFSLVACSGSQNNSSSASTPAANESQVLTNTLVYAGESESTINPLLNNHDELPDLIFSGLMKYDGKGSPIPDLAKSVDYDEATLTYTFHLPNNIKWHDGKTFSAEDVVYTYNLLTKDKSLSSSLTSNYEDINSVTAPDATTVVIRLNKYNAAMLDYFTIGILPKHLTEGKDINTMSFNQSPVGTGRYKFVQWDTAGGRIILQRNENYYAKVPNIERIVYKTVSVESTKATMLQSGEADLAWLNAKYADTFRGKEHFKNIDFKTADYRGISMDFSSKFWQENEDSVGVLNYAIDKNAIVQGVLAGHGTAAYSPIQQSRFGGNKAADLYPYDLSEFAKQMQALGWVKGSSGIYERHGQKFHFTVQVRDYEEERVDIANLCSSQLKAAGVEMEVVLVTRFDWKAGYNGFLSGYAAQFDPDMFYKNYVTGASDNTMNYSNPVVDELLTQGRHTKEEEKRKKIYQEFEAAYAQQPGVVLVAFLDGCYVGIEGLNGLDTTRTLGHHAVGVMWNIEEWTLKK